MSFSIKKLQDGYWFFVRYKNQKLSGTAQSRKEALSLIFQVLERSQYERFADS